MRRCVGIMTLLGLSLASPAFAGTMDCTTTPDTDSAVEALRTAFNTGRAVPMSATDYRAYLVSQWMDSLTTQGKAAMDDQLKRAAQTAPDAIKAQVKNLLTCGRIVCP